MKGHASKWRRDVGGSVEIRDCQDMRVCRAGRGCPESARTDYNESVSATAAINGCAPACPYRSCISFLLES